MLLPQGGQLLSFLKKTVYREAGVVGDGGGSTPNFSFFPEVTSVFPRLGHFHVKSVRWWRKKKLRMSHGVTLWYTIWQQNACVQVESHEYENSYSFIYISQQFQSYASTKDYENMFTLRDRYTSVTKLTTRL